MTTTFAVERLRLAHACTARDLAERLQRDHFTTCERLAAYVAQLRAAGATTRQVRDVSRWFAQCLTAAGLPPANTSDPGRAPRLVALDLLDQKDV